MINLENLKNELKNDLEYIENVAQDNILYKPLEQREIDFIEQTPISNCVYNALLYNIGEKVKKIIEESNNKFKTIITNDKISIHRVEDIYSFETIKLDLSKQTPQIESTIYDASFLDFDIEVCKKTIQRLVITKQELQAQLEVVEQSDTIDDIIYKINEIDYKIEIYIERKNKLEDLSNIINNINLKDFIKIRNKLEMELGIDLNSKAVLKNLIIEQCAPKSITYTIGKKYPVRYVQKTKNIGE